MPINADAAVGRVFLDTWLCRTRCVFVFVGIRGFPKGERSGPRSVSCNPAVPKGLSRQGENPAISMGYSQPCGVNRLYRCGITRITRWSQMGSQMGYYKPFGLK